MERAFDPLKRAYEITPAFISWTVILVFILFAVFKPIGFAVLIIGFDLFWACRLVYLSSLLLVAHRRLYKEKNKNWLSICQQKFGLRCSEIYQAAIFPVYKENLELLVHSLDAICSAHYPKDKMIVVMAFEERAGQSFQIAKELEARYKGVLPMFLATFHPDGIEGETATKGANATWSAKRLKEFVDARKIGHENVVVSCFDADTCVESEYFGCLLYHYLSAADPLRCSYQPMPVYNNNIWHASSFARVVEITSSYCQLIESMRLEKFVTFSSHSMSFKTLVDMDYWPVDKISDDSLIYWKAYLHYNGDYKVVPMYITVSMDVACGKNLWQTLVMQYRQKRRWAWGVEVFPYVMLKFREPNLIPLRKKARKIFNILDSHVNWAVWAVILTVISPLYSLFGAGVVKGTVIGFNLPKVTGVLFNLTNITILLWAIMSLTLLPAWPKDLKLWPRIKIYTQWVFMPFVVMLIGSTPALDAQTRLALGKYMQFAYTEKKRYNAAK